MLSAGGALPSSCIFCGNRRSHAASLQPLRRCTSAGHFLHLTAQPGKQPDAPVVHRLRWGGSFLLVLPSLPVRTCLAPAGLCLSLLSWPGLLWLLVLLRSKGGHGSLLRSLRGGLVKPVGLIFGFSCWRAHLHASKLILLLSRELAANAGPVISIAGSCCACVCSGLPLQGVRQLAQHPHTWGRVPLVCCQACTGVPKLAAPA